jgi:hypothetical protein
MIFIVITLAVIVAAIVLLKNYGDGEIVTYVGISLLALFIIGGAGFITASLTQWFPSAAATYSDKTEEDIISIEETRKLVSAGKTSYYVDAVIITTPSGATDKIRTSNIKWVESDKDVFVIEKTVTDNKILFPFSYTDTDYIVYGDVQ